MVDQVLQSPINRRFFQPLLPGFNSHLNIPLNFFSKHVQGRNKHKTARLRSDASDKTWEVRMEDDGRRLTGGWKEFVEAHDLRIGDVIVFRHEGDLVFHVTALGPSCCEIEYTLSAQNIDDDSDEHNDNIASETRPMKKRAKKNPRREEVSLPDRSCFVANVSVANLRDDKLYVPVSFVRSNGLSKTYGKIVLLDEMGRSWNLSLVHDHRNTFLRHGWRSFCNANGMDRGRYMFKLVRNSGTPVIRLSQAEHRHESDRDSCFVRSLMPSSLRDDTLYLPKKFVRSNGLKKEYCEIVLKNGNGETWNLVLRPLKSNDNMVISGGWRSFCQANGIKVGDPFMFKLDTTGGKLVLCLYLTESNRDTSLVECSEGENVISLSTNPSSGEESSETEGSEEKRIEDISVKEENEEERNSLREWLNIEKWKYCSRTGASSSSSQNRFVTLTITPYSIKSNKLMLPLRFTRVNGMKVGKITLLGQNGVNWKVSLVKEHRHGRMRLGRDWKGFCEVHGLKLGESFVLELIWENDASPVLKFCNKVSTI